MKRREFIGSILSLGPAIALSNSVSFAEAERMNINRMADVVIIGGSLTGCLAALNAARENLKVILIESRSYLGTDITATMRPWIQSQNIDSISDDLKDILFSRKISDDFNIGEIPVQVGAVKKNLLSKLREESIETLFMSDVAGVLINGGQAAGVVIGNKSGLQAILAKTIIDATETASAAYTAGTKRKINQLEFNARRVVEFFMVSQPGKNFIEVPSELGLTGDRVELHRGKYDDTHYYAEFQMPVKSVDASCKEKARWEVEARQKSIQLCNFLISNEPSFKEAVLLQTSPELWLPKYWTLDGIAPNNREVEGCKNLFVTEITWPEKISGDQLNEMQSAAMQLVNTALENIQNIQDSPQLEQLIYRLGNSEVPLHSLIPKKCYDQRFDLTFYSLDMPPIDSIPELDDSNVLVIGGGTSGAPAAISASLTTDNVILVEPSNGLGGTGTHGGITRYYHGYRGGYTAELDEKVLQMEKHISTYHKMRDWNVEAKMMTYFDEIIKAKGFIYYRIRAVGTHVENKAIKAVITTGSDGLQVIRSKVTIDATGDGDLAAWSGVPWHLGGKKDTNIQVFNLGGWRINKKLIGRNGNLGVVDNSDFLDRTRGFYIGHVKRGDYDFSPILCPRESRHIEGDYKVEITDVFSQQRFDDVIAIGKTDYDQHGVQNTIYARLGYLPYHRDDKIVRIPYRACIPKGFDKLYVIGKAFSSQSDAFCFMRMQPDLQNMGYAIGLTAAEAVNKKQKIRDINIKGIQKILLGRGIIREEDVGSYTGLPSPSTLVSSLNEGKEDAFLPTLCTEKSKILPLLEKAYPSASTDGRLYIAMALAWFGSKSGVDELIAKLNELKDKPQSSEVDRVKRPHGGFAGEPSTYWRVNQLIVLLGLVGDHRANGLLKDITANTEAGGPPQEHGGMHWRRIPNYDRILCLCYSLEKFNKEKFIPALDTLLKRPHIGGYVAKSGLDGNENYTSAYLEVVVARTLAKYGGKSGLMVLADYVEDIREVLSDHAYEVLKTITGKDHGKSSQAWKHELSRYPTAFSGD